MKKGCARRRPPRASWRGFTLIELLVVVAIIALLISILLPGLHGARRAARSSVCSANLHQVALAFANYLNENEAVYPPAYVYPINERGDWSPTGQSRNKEYGYLHWSWFLYEDGKVNPKAFTCPEFERGGLARTNPGPEGRDWEPSQIDDTGGGPPGSREDKQAPRIAYTANAAIVPRNKFTRELSGGIRVNVFATETNVLNPRAAVLATEFLNSGKAISVPSGDRFVSKSHRPINPFYHLGYGSNEYTPPLENGDFIYGTPADPKTYGLLPYDQVLDSAGLIENANVPETNAVGRHHPGGDALGGTANFLCIDGSVRRKTILKTLEQREWGDRYYSLNGNSDVLWGNN